jgi:DNA-binding MarR family transcriptional regulator
VGAATDESREEKLQRLAMEVRALSSALEDMQAATSQHTGLNRTDMRALELISRRDGLTAGEMAVALNLTTGAITGVIDRLEGAGHARREPDAEDRRRVLIRPTDAAHATGRQLFQGLAQSIHDALGCYSDEQLGLFLELLARVRQAVGERSQELAGD